MYRGICIIVEDSSWVFNECLSDSNTTCYWTTGVNLCHHVLLPLHLTMLTYRILKQKNIQLIFDFNNILCGSKLLWHSDIFVNFIIYVLYRSFQEIKNLTFKTMDIHVICRKNHGIFIWTTKVKSAFHEILIPQTFGATQYHSCIAIMLHIHTSIIN